MKKDISILPDASIKEALKKLDKTAEKTLFVVDNQNKLLGTITDGDIRRYILKTGTIEGKIEEVYNKNPIKIFKTEFNIEKVKSIMLKNKIEVIPVLDENNRVVDYYTWQELFSETLQDERKFLSIDIPVVIMAGGKGTRLDPLTKILPKPIIPIGEKTMVEYIIDNFKKFGIKHFCLILNYKGAMIEAYFNSIEKDYQIEFIWEKEFLGTAGGIKLLENKITGDFIVSNCDILVKADFYDVYNYHKDNGSFLTSITSIQHHKIPYGVVNIQNGGEIKNIEEKPEYTFQINTGVYFLNSKIFKYIPLNKYFDMPELIKSLIKDNKKVLAYPVNESDYIDMGQWEEYKMVLKNFLEV